MRSIALGAIVLSVQLLLSGCGQAERKRDKDIPAKGLTEKDAQVELKTTSLKDLESDIAKHKGKIVVMDLWGVWCPPCKKEFHNLVRLHHTYGKDGVACLSLCLPAGDEGEKSEATAFLKEKKAVTGNYFLEEKGTDPIVVAKERWKFEGIPVVVVYDRDGSIAKVFTRDDPKEQFTYEDVEKLVKKLVKG